MKAVETKSPKGQSAEDRVQRDGPGSQQRCASGQKDGAELTGADGMVYALDVNPLSIGTVDRIAAENGLSNVKTILSDCATGLSGENIHVGLLYDIFHLL